MSVQLSELIRPSGYFQAIKLGKGGHYWIAFSFLIGVVLSGLTIACVGTRQIVESELRQQNDLVSLLGEPRMAELVESSSTPGHIALTCLLAGVETLAVVLIVSLLLDVILAFAGYSPKVTLLAPIVAITWSVFLLVNVGCELLFIVCFRGSLDIDLADPLSTNLAGFFSKGATAPWTYSLLSSVDVFVFGALLLLAFGMHQVVDGLRFRSAIVCVMFLWLISTGARVLFVGVSSLGA